MQQRSESVQRLGVATTSNAENCTAAGVQLWFTMWTNRDATTSVKGNRVDHSLRPSLANCLSSLARVSLLLRSSGPASRERALAREDTWYQYCTTIYQ